MTSSEDDEAPLLVSLSPERPTRIAERDLSSVRTGEYNIVRRSRSMTEYARDSFNTLLNMNFYGFYSFVISTLLSLHVAFALAYLYVDCEPGYQFGLKGQLSNALLFSASIANSSGFFQSKEITWRASGPAVVLVLFHSLFTVVWMVFVFGMVVIRLANGFSRGRSLVFSDRALITEESDGTVVFCFRFCESRRHQLVQAEMVCHFIDHSPGHSTQAVTCERLKLQNSEKDIFTALPLTVRHVVDDTSPFCPPSMRNIRNESHCDICGDSFRDHKALIKHQSYEGHIGAVKKNEITLDNVRDGLEGRWVEVIVNIHGWDPISSASSQMLWSYFGPEEIQCGGDFLPCVTYDMDNVPVVNFKNLSTMT